MEEWTLDEINALPPQLLADMRCVRIGMDDPNNPAHRQLRDFMNQSPGKFLEQMNGLEKAYQGQIGRQKAQSKPTEEKAVPAEEPVVEAKEEKILELIKRLRKEWGDEQAE
jgi:hypothetical protein